MWALDPQTVYLNHGSFGSCPTPVLDEQRRLRAEMELNPVRFLGRDLQPRLADVRAVLGRLVGADPADLALVTNATTAVNTVMRSLVFEPGDEILTTNHEYNACLNAVDVVAKRSGAMVVQAHVPFPLTGPDEVVEAIVAAVTPRTKIALVSHVTSATAVVFPIERIVAELEARGVDVLVDGAHSTAHLELDIDSIGAAYYAATLHKWLCSPRGTGFLHVRQDRQHLIRPLVISHGTNDPNVDAPLFRREFDWQGSHDPTGFLAIPKALETISGLVEGGLPALRLRNHELVLRARDALCQVLDEPNPIPDRMLSAMAVVPIDNRFRDDRARQRLDRVLRDDARIEIGFMLCRLDPDRWMIRVSCQAYNDETDVEALSRTVAAALRD